MIQIGQISPSNTKTWNPSIKGNPHMLIAGLPGMGKTTLLLNTITQLTKMNIQPILFSFHEDIDQELIKLYSNPHILNQQNLTYDPMKLPTYCAPTDYLDVAANMRDIFKALWPSLGDIQAQAIYHAFKVEYTYSIRQNRTPYLLNVYKLLSHEAKQRKELKSLSYRLSELHDYGIFKNTTKSQSLWKHNRNVTIIQLHKSKNDNVQKALAYIVFYRLYQTMSRMGPSKQIDFAIIFDEAHKAANLPLLPTMAKECRKYGISLILASQEARDFHPSLYSAIANYCILKVNETDARALAKNIASENEIKKLSDNIKKLQKFEAIFADSQNNIDKLKLLPPPR